MDPRYWIIILMFIAVITLSLLNLYCRRLRHRLADMDAKSQRLQKERQENIDALNAQIRDYENASSPQPHPDSPAVDPSLITGNSAVDALLQDMDRLAKQKGANLTCRIAAIPPDLLKEQQLISLLSNLLDNAIEAAAPLHGEVTFESRILKGQWVLITENTKSPSQSPLETNMRSTKSGENHGLGSKIIDHIVSQADGYIDRTDKGDTFRIFIAIPLGGTTCES